MKTEEISVYDPQSPGGASRRVLRLAMNDALIEITISIKHGVTKGLVRGLDWGPIHQGVEDHGQGLRGPIHQEM